MNFNAYLNDSDPGERHRRHIMKDVALTSYYDVRHMKSYVWNFIRKSEERGGFNDLSVEEAVYFLTKFFEGQNVVIQALLDAESEIEAGEDDDDSYRL